MTTDETRIVRGGGESEDSDAARRFLRGALDRLAKVPYDPQDGLPIRPDVLYWAREHLAGENFPSLYPGSLPLPDVGLEPAGTVAIAWDAGGRSLDLHVACKAVVLYCKTFEDGETQVSGHLPGSMLGDTGLLDGMFGWLAEGVE